MPSTPDPERGLGHLVLRPDVTPGRGLGHLQRSLALGEAWQRAGGQAVLLVPPVSSGDPERGVTRLSGRTPSEGHRAAVTERAASAGIPAVDTIPGEADWMVLDGYDVAAADQEEARGMARRVGLIDDHGRMAAHVADLVVDQNLGASPDSYGPGVSRSLLGPGYALLREAFVVPTGGASPNLDLLVTLGGSPSDEAVAFVAATLALLDLPADTVGTVGSLGTPVTKRGEVVASLGRPTDLATTLAAARAALSAAGSTAWEMCATGTPAVLVAVADNQEPVGEALADAGVADYLGPVHEADPQRAADAIDSLLSDSTRWEQRRAAGSRLVDGRGADRVVTAMRALDVDLRPATAEDARTLWEWANDPIVRASAFDSTPIAWDDHVAWLDARLADPGTSIHVAVDGDEPWGQVRLDAVDGARGEAVVGVSVAADRRGQGLAGPLLAAAVTRALAERPDLHRVVAEVKADNAPSRRAFDRAAFVEVDGTGDRTGDVVTLQRERADG